MLDVNAAAKEEAGQGAALYMCMGEGSEEDWSGHQVGIGTQFRF